MNNSNPTGYMTPKVKVGNFRWVIVALVFFATTINYVDRQVIGILAPTLQKDIGWTEVEYGNIVAAFTAAGKLPASNIPSANLATPNPKAEPAKA